MDSDSETTSIVRRWASSPSRQRSGDGLVFFPVYALSA